MKGIFCSLKIAGSGISMAHMYMYLLIFCVVLQALLLQISNRNQYVQARRLVRKKSTKFFLDQTTEYHGNLKSPQIYVTIYMTAGFY